MMDRNATQPPTFLQSLETPNLFASYRIGDHPQAGLHCHPWDMTGTQAVLLNAFDLLANRRTHKYASDLREGKVRLHKCVEFDGPLMLDSGAYNFQQHAEISIKPLDVLSIGLKLGADVSVVLDHPFLPTSDHEERKLRWSNTVKNTHSMFEELQRRNGDFPENFQLMPVLHGHDTETLKRSLGDILEIWGQEPDIVGVGSLAPLARNGSKRTVIDVILTARRLLPDAHIHCFSLGSALLMLFAFYCGADTVDSQTWIMSAAFKQVQLPGFHLTRFSPREKAGNPAKYQQSSYAFAQRLLQLIDEEDFTVKDWDNGKTWPIRDEMDAFSYLEYLEDRDGKNHVHRRACHNLYAFNFETSRVREEMRKGELETFIASRMKSTVYRNVFEHAIERVSSKP